jgi:RNA polymerase sigma factor (sigma-70 family)
MAQSPDISPQLCESLISRMQAGDPNAEEELYEICSGGIRTLLQRHLIYRTDVNDKMHDIYIIAVKAIRKCVIREPNRLMGFLHVLVRREIVRYNRQCIRRSADIEIGDLDEDICDVPARDLDLAIINRERQETVIRMLHTIPARNCEVLMRLYLRGESHQQVCSDMKLTPQQVSYIKWRAIQQVLRSTRNASPGGCIPHSTPRIAPKATQRQPARTGDRCA